MDRNKKDELPKLQVGFIDFVCTFVYKVSKQIVWEKCIIIWMRIFLSNCNQNKKKRHLHEKPLGVSLFLQSTLRYYPNLPFRARIKGETTQTWANWIDWFRQARKTALVFPHFQSTELAHPRSSESCNDSLQLPAYESTE